MAIKPEDLAARRGALQLLSAVLAAGRTIDEAEAGANSALEGPDRARARRLCAEVLRNLGRADAVLEPLLERKPVLKVRNALRLAVVEVGALGAPAHGAVSAAVEIVRRSPKTKHQAGFANAVLRRATEGLAQHWAEMPVDRLPKWLRNSLVASWGEDRVRACEAAHACGAPIDLTPGPAMDADTRAALEFRDLPTGSLRLTTQPMVSQLPGFEQGAFWVQDAAAAIPARALRAQPGEKVLDLCAAPGGKTMQLSATGAEVVAVDASPSRMDRLGENLARTGLQAVSVTADLMNWAPPEPVDAILLDAPCSATGTIRRHPDLPYVRDGNGLRDLAALQSKLIDRALGWLRPGGRLVYATCSLLPMEGEAQAIAALERNPGIQSTAGAFDLPGIAPEWVGEAGLRLFPDYWSDIGGMDGFFVAHFTKD